MNKTNKYQILESNWKNSWKWTFELIDILKNANNDRAKAIELAESKKVLSSKKEVVFRRREEIFDEIQELNLYVKPVRNYIKALEKLLNSTIVDFSKTMKNPLKPFDLFDSIDEENLDNYWLNRYIEIVKHNLEENWISFNQSYGRALIKLKINNYETE